MKKIIFVLMAICLMAGTLETKAQVSVSVNIGTPPAWGPYGYDDCRYYFLPDIDVYYDVWYGNYWYLDGGTWVCGTILPPRYGYFNFYNGYKVVLGYRGNNPYRYYHDHCNRYYSYRNYHGARQITYHDRGGYHGRSYAPARGGNNRPPQGGGRGAGNAPRLDNHGRENMHQGAPGNQGGGFRGGRQSTPAQQGGGSQQRGGSRGGRQSVPAQHGGGGQPRGNGGGGHGHHR